MLLPRYNRGRIIRHQVILRNTCSRGEIVLVNAADAYVASLFFNLNEIEIHMLKTINEPYRQAIAALFAVIVSTKNQ